ncbi:thiol-disulfide isomerase/thioredoxin [Lewinella marina]|uniref:Alkyl hydroperoxide reductase n=1 Tax=Neolewinella marina TaxID=438751 RepID=A0A2G0CEV8_9BACT|nr:TlpA disulfide reductase family protein [Neolewinella marina]NJB85818.1 thiol-disulfide isomerase/thioredoxin [Neolewinella marina]PHK98513.1 alkyl hydroperoxide reductase [Neolewinella marina]
MFAFPRFTAPALGALILIGLTVASCVFVQDRYAVLPPGPYRGVLELEYNPIVPNPKGEPIPEKVNLEFDEVTEGQLPFTFDVVYEDDTTFHLVIHNGEEEILVPAKDIQSGRDQSVGRDTLRIDFPVYDTHISAYHEENVIEGVWVVHYRDNYRIPFKAYFGKNHRFTPLKKEPVADLSGQWAVTFAGDASEDPYPGVAEFRQEGNHLTGTFLTETGDYRYLEGTVQANKAYLSVFDGSHAFLFEALIREDGSLTGTFRSGRHYITDWTAVRDDQAELTSPDELTRLREDVPLSFAFPDVNGDTLRLEDLEGPKIVQLFGTWCPNCRDETNFLKEYLAENETGDLKVVALAFERYGADDPRSRAAVERYRDNMEVEWPVLLAASNDKREASRALPMLNKVISYPTLLFVDRNNRVVRIHTGFNGPATSKYAAFKESFDETIEELIAPEGK